MTSFRFQYKPAAPTTDALDRLIDAGNHGDQYAETMEAIEAGIVELLDAGACPTMPDRKGNPISRLNAIAWRTGPALEDAFQRAGERQARNG